VPDFPARRIDDRKLGPELALPAEVVGEAARVLACGAQSGGKLLHLAQFNE
jgi:hypothetical protein